MNKTYKLINQKDNETFDKENSGKDGKFPVLYAIGLHGKPIVIDKDSFRGNKIIGWNVDHNFEIVEEEVKDSE